MARPIIIIGLQKSGTSLLKKILASSGHVVNLFPAEGNGLWGNTPPFSPSKDPVGKIYQQYKGQKGHSLSESDFEQSHLELISSRLNRELLMHDSKTFWLNKNPYLTVRLTWLKKVLPDAIVLACVRKPLPNIYSLFKRYTKSLHGLKPENGWWGVKPNMWNDLVGKDHLITATNQWHSVNSQLLHDLDHVDYLIPYHCLSESTEMILSTINSIVGVDLACETPYIECMDDEWQTGGSAISANQSIHNNNHPEMNMPPLTQQQIELITSQCDPLWEQIKSKAS